MMAKKPVVSVLILAEPEPRDAWYQRLSGVRARGASLRPVVFETEFRVYRLCFRSAEPGAFAAVILLVWSREEASVHLRSNLLVAARAGVPAYVISCNSQESSQHKRDQEEQFSRVLLSGLGFSGDEATLFFEAGILPSPECFTRLLASLDANDALLSPPGALRPYPEKNKVVLVAEALEELRMMARPVVMIESTRDNFEKLTSIPIGFRPGDAPSRSRSAPSCMRCPGEPMRFQWELQIPAGRALPLGSYLFYSCERTVHDAKDLSSEVVYEPREHQEVGLSFTRAGSVVSVRELEHRELIELPELWTTRSARFDKLKSQIKRPPASWPDSKPTEYQVLSGMLGAQPHTAKNSQALQIGGVSLWSDRCPSCQRSLDVLAIVPSRPWLKEAQLRLAGLRFMVCHCDPAKIYTMPL